MAKPRKIITNYDVSLKLEPIYTSGDIWWSTDGKFIVSQCDDDVAIVDLDKSLCKQKILADDDPIVSFTCDSARKYVITSHKSGLLRQWDFDELKLLRTWKSLHIGPIKTLVFDDSGTLVASAGTDSVIKIWDIYKQYCTHHLKGGFGIFSCVTFCLKFGKPVLYAAGDDLKIRGWNLNNSKQEIELVGHYGHVTGIIVLSDRQLVSCGRDKVILIWDLEKQCVFKTIVSTCPLECMDLVVDHYRKVDCKAMLISECVVAGGSTGEIQVWDLHTYKMVLSYKELEVSCSSVKYNSQLGLLDVSHFDQTIIRHKYPELSISKKFVGHNDEILSLCFVGKDESFVAMATNSPVIKLYQLSDLTCELLYGHSQTVLSVSSWRNDVRYFTSSSKDNSIRVWYLETGDKKATCICMTTGHTSSVTCVATNFLSLDYMVSGSDDLCIKCYKLNISSKGGSLIVKATQVAHDKTINSIAISPNDRLVATGSQDHTAKLWSSDMLTLVGVLKGHKKGIWVVRFSEVDQILATGSADTNIKLWSVSDLACLKTFQGHEGSVLGVVFVNSGTQIVSSGGEGLIKLWDIKSNQCTKTSSNHDDRIWDLISKDDGAVLVTGGADSCMLLWRDVSEEDDTKARIEIETRVREEQELENFMNSGNLRRALNYCLRLGRPHQALVVIKTILGGGEHLLIEALKNISHDRLMQLMEFCVVWNSNSRHCHSAQVVLNYILESVHPDDLLRHPNINNIVQQLLPYLDRHFARYSKLQESLHFLNYTHHCLSLAGSDSQRDEYKHEATSLSNLLDCVLKEVNVKQETTVNKEDQEETLSNPSEEIETCHPPLIIESNESDEENQCSRPLVLKSPKKSVRKNFYKKIKL